MTYTTTMTTDSTTTRKTFTQSRTSMTSSRTQSPAQTATVATTVSPTSQSRIKISSATSTRRNASTKDMNPIITSSGNISLAKVFYQLPQTITNPLIGPPDILIGWHRFYRDSSCSFLCLFLFLFLFFFFFFFIRQLPYEFTEPNSAKTSHTLASDCDLKMYVQNLEYRLRLKIGGLKIHLCSTFFDNFAT